MLSPNLSSSLKKIGICVLLLVVAACEPMDKPFTGVKIGKPYSINGKTYIPTPDSSYDKVGEGSWYGPGFHGRNTANGEKFDQNDITAAHPTLPMPSLVLVTNLSNDRSVVVRVNDRGPFHNNRIIDLSKRAAEFIDLRSTQLVRVQFLDEETKEYLQSIKGKSPKIDMVAYNEAYNRKIKEMANTQLIQTAVISYAQESDSAPVQSVSASDLNEPQAKELTESRQPEPEAVQLVEKRSVIKDDVALSEQGKMSDTQENKSQHTYVILAGSFSTKANAEKLAKSLNSIPNHKKLVSVDKVDSSGKAWWRVHVGKFSDKDKAKQVLRIVENAGIHDAILKKL